MEKERDLGGSENADAEALLSSYDGIVETGTRTKALRPYEAIIVRVK